MKNSKMIKFITELEELLGKFCGQIIVKYVRKSNMFKKITIYFAFVHSHDKKNSKMIKFITELELLGKFVDK